MKLLFKKILQASEDDPGNDGKEGGKEEKMLECDIQAIDAFHAYLPDYIKKDSGKKPSDSVELNMM